METSMAGKPSNSGFETARPVSGLTPTGKESESGPRALIDRRGWAAGVKVGMTVAVGSRVSVGTLVAVGPGVFVAVATTSALACGAQEVSKTIIMASETREFFIIVMDTNFTNCTNFSWEFAQFVAKDFSPTPA
jgi:hypothetical protein